MFPYIYMNMAKEEKDTPCLLTLLTQGERKDEKTRKLKKKKTFCAT